MGFLLRKFDHKCQQPEVGNLSAGSIWRCDGCGEYYMVVELGAHDSSSTYWYNISEETALERVRDAGDDWLP